MDVLSFIMALQERKQKQKQQGELNQILQMFGQGMQGQPAMPGIDMPPDMPTDVYSPFYNPAAGGMEGRPAVPAQPGGIGALRPGFVEDMLSNPKFSPQTKMAGMKLFEQLQPQKKEFLTLGAGQEATDIRTGEKIKGPAAKQHWQAVQGEENFWLFNPETQELKETNTAIKGKKEFSDPYQDEQGNTVQKNLKTSEIKVISKAGEAPKTREYKKNGKLITEEWDPVAKKYKPLAEAPREIEKPSEISQEKKRQIDIWKDAINTTLKKYGKPGFLFSTEQGLNFGEGQVAYDSMVQKSKTDPVAKRDLGRIDDWIEKISGVAGIPKAPANRRPLSTFEGR